MRVPKVIAVVGISRSGQSCLCGMLAKLGVEFGQSAFRPDKRNPHGYFEARGLTRVCRQAYQVKMGRSPLVEFVPIGTHAQRVKMLRHWAVQVTEHYNCDVIGAKKFKLSLMLPEMAEAWPRLKVIATYRPIEDILKSMRTGSGFTAASAAQRRAAIQACWDRRDADLARLKIPAIRVSFADVMRDPSAVVTAMVAFAELSPTKEQIAAAVAHVDRSLNHHTLV